MEKLNLIQQDLVNGISTSETIDVLNSLINDPPHSSECWSKCLTLLKSTTLNSSTIRSYRGLLILTKLLTQTNYLNNVKDILLLIDMMNTFITSLPNSEYDSSIIAQFCETLANLSNYNGIHLNTSDTDKNTDRFVNQILSSINKIPDLSILPKPPIILFITNLIKNSSSTITDSSSYDTSINPFIQHLFKMENLLSLLLNYFESIDFDNLTNFDALLIDSLQLIISDESFGKWITCIENDSTSLSNRPINEAADIKNSIPSLDSFESTKSFKWLQLAQLIIPEKNNWNNSQKLCLLSWTNDLFKLYYPLVIETIGKETAEAVKISLILDIFSELCQIDLIKNGFIDYNMIDPIIKLFGMIHRIIPISNAIKPSNTSIYSHPHVKSTIIEIISYLAYENKSMQDKIRDLNGLELVLSNCVIDDNNPYIKERAISCLKFLLANNQLNQNVIRELEEKGNDTETILGLKNEVVM